MARPPKPTRILELNGAFKHDPKRRARRGQEPKAPGMLGGPPDWLDKDEKATWIELKSQIAAEVAESSDTAAFTTLCKLYTALRMDGIGGRRGLTASMISIMNGLFVQFGMTPASRSKISVAKPKEESNPFASLDEESTEAVN